MRKRFELNQKDTKNFLIDKFGEDIFLPNKCTEELSLDKIAKKALRLESS